MNEDDPQPTKRSIPRDARELTTDEFDHWCELAGRFEFDDGRDGHAADTEALFVIYDERQGRS